MDRFVFMKNNYDSYYNYYKYPKPETPSNAKLLNSLMHVDFRPLEEYNAIQKFNAAKLKTLPVETNPHHISHYVRSVFENRNIIEHIKFFVKPREGTIVTNRRIIDINATRILKAGLNPILLTPQLAADDAERVSNTKMAIRQYEYDIRNKLTKEEIEDAKYNVSKYYDDCRKNEIIRQKNKRAQYDEDRIDEIDTEYTTFYKEAMEIIDNREDQFTMDHYDETLQQASQNGHIPRSALINLTDIIYYLTKDDLYLITNNMEDGVVIVGTAHVPKYLDTDEHLIKYEFIDKSEKDLNKNYIYKEEGKVRIVPISVQEREEYTLPQCRMLMKMKGNAFQYEHSIEYMSFLHADLSAEVIRPSVPYPFILRCVPVERVDCGATYYVRYQIHKISNPSAVDLISDQINATYVSQYNYANERLRERRQNIQHNNRRNEIMRANLQVNEGQQQPVPREKPVMAYNVIALNAKFNALNQNQVPLTNDPVKLAQIQARIVNPDNITIRKTKIQKINQKDMKPEEARKYLAEQYFEKPLFLKDGNYYFTKTVKSEETDAFGRHTIYTIREQIDDITDFIYSVPKVVNPQLINKLTARIMSEPELDTVTMKSLIKYINSNAPDLDIPNQVIPLLADILMRTFTAEKRLGALMQSSLIRNMQAFRNGEYKIEEYKEPNYNIFEKIWRWLTALWRDKEVDVKLQSSPQDFRARPASSPA